jgi:hypothetical protein
VRTLKPRLRTLDSRIVRPPAKQVEPFYLSPEYRDWRAKVIARAGGRCEVVENGQRCTKAQPQHRMFAHHIRERSDGGDPLDPTNGECRCGAHHTLITAQNRATRLGVPIARG